MEVGAQLRIVSAENAGSPSCWEPEQCGPQTSLPPSQGPGLPHTVVSAGGRESRATGILISYSCCFCRLLPWTSLPLLSLSSSILPDPHSPPHIPCSPWTVAVASPVLQSFGPDRTEPHSQRAQSRMRVGRGSFQSLSSSAIGEAGSSQAQERHWGPGIPRSGITRTGSTEEEWHQQGLPAFLGTWCSSPTHVLGEEEAIDFSFLFRDDPGVCGDHRVEAAGKRKSRLCFQIG